MGSWAGANGVVRLPDGRHVRGRALRVARAHEDRPPELGVYLAGRPHHEAWESIWIRWPDFGLPADRAGAVDVLRYAHEEAQTRRVEIACAGGSGRTGAAIAVLARLAGVPAGAAVAWTRVHYRRGACETPWQRRFVERVDLGPDSEPGS